MITRALISARTIKYTVLFYRELHPLIIQMFEDSTMKAIDGVEWLVNGLDGLRLIY